jgi:predicted membrane protein
MNFIDDYLLNPYNNLLFLLSKNIFIIVLLLFLVGLILYEYIEDKINLVHNILFKLIIFGIITFLGGINIAIAVFLGIIVFVLMQTITNMKFRKEFHLDDDIDNLENESFKHFFDGVAELSNLTSSVIEFWLLNLKN